MESCIYEGWVRHRRYTPAEHSFRNRLYLMYLDLNELDDVFRGRVMWSAKRTAFARFRRDDHLGDASRPLAESVRDFVSDSGRARPQGPIRLLTHLRYLGYVFNPVSFYFCFDREGRNVQAVVAEVNNTPWGEQHCYVLDPEQFAAGGSDRRLAKQFHVSPFMPMDVEYQWQLSKPGSALTVNIENYRDHDKLFDVTMRLARREITTANLARALVCFPLMTFRVIVGIYWQALRLWLKRCRIYPHPQTIAPETKQGKSTTRI